MTRLLSLLLVLFGAAGYLSARPLPGRAAAAQYYSSGTLVIVHEDETGDPLVGATVTVASRADTMRGVTVKKDWGFSVAAAFRCDKLFRDSVDLSVSYLGYKDFNKRYSAREFAGYIQVKMEVDEQSIAQVVVTGKQVAMVFRGDTIVYNAGAFKTFSDDKLSELLKQLPGVEIRDNKIYAGGQEVKRVYVDGRNFFGSNTSFSLTDMVASDVKNVRVYEEQSPEARHSGDTSAPKEKVMDVETKSKRSALLGGEVALLGGASFEKDYSGRREIRHTESGSFYRHNERGSLRLSADNAKDASPGGEMAQSKMTPTKLTTGGVTYEFRRGDTTNVMTMANFSRNKSSSINTSTSEYFPSQSFTLRQEENSSQNLSKQLSADIHNFTMIRRGKNGFSASTSFSLNDGNSTGQSRTSQRIDDQTTLTRQRSDNDNRALNLNLNLHYRRTLTEKSWLVFTTAYSYSTQRQDGWRVDTLASVPGLRVKLKDGGNIRQQSVSAGAAYQYSTGEKSSFSAGYDFRYNYKSAEQRAIDYLDDPRGVLDTVNSYDYTVDYTTNGISASWSHNGDKFQFMGQLSGSLYLLTRDEYFPQQEHSPRNFFQLTPFVYMSIGKPERKLHLSLMSNPQVPSAEALRNTLDAKNPLALTAGNPDLKMPNDVNFSLDYSLENPEKARSLRFGLSGSYTFNYITSRRRLFLEETYLPQYDYTAQAGAQLSTEVNVAGNYGLGGNINYSQQLTSLRSTLNLGVNYEFSQSPYFLDETLYSSASHRLSVNAGISTGFSTKVKINIRTNTSMSSYATQDATARDLRETVNVRLDLRFGKFFAFAGTAYDFYCNSRSKTLTRHTVVTNLAAGYKFGKKDQLSLSVGATDIFNRPDNTTTSFQTDYILTSRTSYLGRYGYIRAAYTF